MRVFKRLLALSLCAAILLSLAGCRYSSVLEQMIYDMRKGQETDYDTDFEPEENDPENEETSDDLKDLEQDDEAERVTDSAPELDIAEEQEEEPEEEEPEETPGVDSTQLEYLPEAETEQSAAVGEAVADSTAQTEEQTPTTSAGADAVQSSETEPETTPVEEAASTLEETTPSPDADTGGEADTAGETGGAEAAGTDCEAKATAQTYKQVVDAYGQTVDIPEDVDTVAAVGELAVMILILDGPERLAATNAALDAGLAAAAYPELSEVPALWSGSGETALSADNFQALLEAAPDVVLECSGSTTVTDAQAQVLAEAGIAYLVLPQPASLSNIQTIMTTLGTVLGDKSEEGGANASQRAEEYISWVQATAQTVSQVTASYAAYTDDDTGVSVSGTYTLYVDSWDDNAAYRLYSENYVTLSGTGCAVIQNGATTACKTLSSYLGLANVVNTASQYGISPKALYFTPLISAYRTMEVTGTAADGMVSAGQKLLEQSDGSLGTDSFSILLVSDSHTAEGIRNSVLWAVYPHINSGDGSFNSDGFLDEEGNLVRTQISGEYEIVVNPSGLSSWTGGSAESILESVWAAWRFFDAISEQEMRSYISEFYSLFYGYALSDAELNSILEGP